MKKLIFIALLLLLIIPFVEAKDNGFIERIGDNIILTYDWETVTINEKEVYDQQKCSVWYHIWTAEDWSKALKLWYNIKWKDYEHISLYGNNLFWLSEYCSNKDNDCYKLATIADDFWIKEMGNSKIWIIRTASKWPRNYPYLLVYHWLNWVTSNLDSTLKNYTTSIGLETCENVYVPNVYGMEGNQCNRDFKAYCFKDDKTMNNWFSKEYNDAYIFAYNKNITTMPTIEKANMYWEIKRMEIAKMLSNWARAYQDPKISCNFTDTSSVKWDLATAIIASCKMWIMWQWITKFRPYDNITKAEVATAVSRILRQSKYDWWNPYYINHVNALKNAWVLSDTSNIKANMVRWDVMVMLMKANDILEKQ